MNISRFNQFISEKSGIALKYSALDWDDNILHMSTPIHMDKLVDGKWVATDVSTSEFAEIRSDKVNYRLINNNPMETFSEFRDFGPRGKMAFITDVKEALENKQYGPAWDAFIKCLINGNIFCIITARGHEPQTIRNAVEYIIDNELSESDKLSLYDHCLKNAYFFTNEDTDKYDRVYRGKLSKTPLIKLYLDNCDYYGVTSQSFAKEFGEVDGSNPEHAKQEALDKFINKCNSFGSKVGAKSVSVGFSDDDPKNIDHVNKYFKEKSALTNDLGHRVKLVTYRTTDRTIKGGEKTRFHEYNETSNQPTGLENSIISCTQMTNDTQWHYPNTRDAPRDDYHNRLKNQTKLANFITKEFAYNRKTKKKK